jgi:hypothetical protein
MWKFWVKEFWIVYLVDGFGDRGDQIKNRDGEHYIGNDCFRGFYGFFVCHALDLNKHQEAEE